MYRGVSPGSGSGGSDEVGPLRTVNLRIGAGTPPACANLSQSVPQNGHGDQPPARLRVGRRPDRQLHDLELARPRHARTRASLNSGLVGYTSNAGFSGADSFGYRATSTCGAASCQSPEATFDLTVLNPQQGPDGADRTDRPHRTDWPNRHHLDRPDRLDRPARRATTGATGATGAQGAAGQNGKDGAVVSFDRLVVASFLDALTVRRGKAVLVRYVSTTTARVVLEVFKGSRRVAAISGRAKEGRNSIRWNGKVAPEGGGRRALQARAPRHLGRPAGDGSRQRPHRRQGRAEKRPSGGGGGAGTESHDSPFRRRRRRAS